MNSFAQLNVSEPIARTLATLGYTSPTPIQMRSIPPLLEGRDLLGCAQTGTGKTAAFAIPIIDRIARIGRPTTAGAAKKLRALVLTPTRELAVQVGASLTRYGKNMRVRCAVIHGGISQHGQVKDLRDGVDVVVATPGRLLDLLDQGHLSLGSVEMLVLDEADRMLDMGFIRPIREILSLLPRQRQTMLFSATMPPAIAKLAESALRDPVRISVAPQSTPARDINQRVRFVSQSDKGAALVAELLDKNKHRVLVFTRTKRGANRVAQLLDRNRVSVSAIHGNKSQSARQRALDGFKDGKIRVLVATDVASRGIDVHGISHVINFDIPQDPESYVHRIGRTGRAGADGAALSLCDHAEMKFLRDIERVIGAPIPIDGPAPKRQPGRQTKH